MAKIRNKGKKGRGPKRNRLQSMDTVKKKVLNPFEIHVNKQKHDVLGRKSKNDRGLPGVARAKAMQKRKATLLQEYRIQNKSNKFLDRRIGEKNRAMTGDDRMMARFTAERMKIHNKKTMFNLADDEILTHHGQTLNEVEKFDDPRSDDDEDEKDQGNLDSSFVKDAHFGGGILTKSSNAQSRKDLIDQLIAESKKRKAEQKKFREQTQELTDKLDTEWKDLLPIISTTKKLPGGDTMDVDKPDDYDTMIRELKFEARGKPTDRLKSEEEIALEEKERLEKLEADRLRRMQGLTTENRPQVTHRSADDLDDGFEMETLEDTTVAYDADGNLDQQPSLDDGQSDHDSESETEEAKKVSAGSSSEDHDEGSDDTDNEEEDDLEDMKSDSDSDSAQADLQEGDLSSPENVDKTNTEEPLIRTGLSSISKDEKSSLVRKLLKPLAKTKDCVEAEKVADNDVDMEVKPNREKLIKEDLKERRLMMEKARQELPYTFKAPETYEELQELMNDRSPEYQAVIMERLVKCTHPSLADGNKDKLATMFAFLLQHLHDIASQETGDECFVVLDRVAPQLYDVAIISPGNARRCVAEVLKEKQSDYQQQRHQFPQQDTLIFLKVVSLLFPTSDFRHPVVTPALVFMGQMLTTCRVKTRRDIACGLFIATLVLEYTVLSKRFCPAVINFLLVLLQKAVSSNKREEHLLKLPKNFLCSSDVSLLSLKELSTELNIDDNFCYQAIAHTLRLLTEFFDHFNNLPSIFQIFEPVLLLNPKNLPTTLSKQVEHFQSSVKALGSRKMPILIPEAKKPKLLRLYDPSFDKVYDGKKFKVMGRERQERAKLLHKVKRETKGALREIRRDKAFIAKLKIKETMKSDAERRAKVKEIFGSAANQQGELKALERKKKK